MRTVERMEAIPIAYPDPNDFGSTQRTVLVKVTTDDGIVGWGECIAMWPEACRATAIVIEEGLAPVLRDLDATDVEAAWQAMRRHVWWYGEGGIASLPVSGVDTALWDLAGKAAGRPLHALLGGLRHDRLPANASCHVNKEGLRACVDEAVGFFGAGFRSAKFGFGRRCCTKHLTDGPPLSRFEVSRRAA